jgi:hypothetical protein
MFRLRPLIGTITEPGLRHTLFRAVAKSLLSAMGVPLGFLRRDSFMTDLGTAAQLEHGAWVVGGTAPSTTLDSARAARVALYPTQDLGEPGGRVAAQRLAVPEARYFGIERGEAPRGCGGGRRIGVEYPEHRLAIVGGQRVAGHEHPVLLKPCSPLARRVTGRAHDHRVVLPAERSP